MQTNETSQVKYAALVGLDWADQKHSICLQVAHCSQVEEYTLKQTPESLHDWVLKLRDRFGGEKIALTIEQTRGAVIHALLDYDFVHIYRIPPKSLAKYRQAVYPSGAKDDPTDAALLLEWAKLHRDKIKPWVPDTPKDRALQRLVEFRRKTVDRQVALTNALGQLLKEYFPQALEWAGELNTVMACDFLSKWPTLEKIQKAQPSQIRKFYLEHGCRRSDLIEQRLNQIRTARPLTQDYAIVSTSSIMLQTIVPQLRCLIAALPLIESQINEIFLDHPDAKIFKSFPGAGPALAPRLQAAMGSDRRRFHSAQEVQQFSGIAPVTESSGKITWVHQRLACPKFVRQTFHEFSGQSIRFSRWARAFYDLQRARGKRHHAAVRSLAFKWIRIIYSCWQKSVPYNEQMYLVALQRRNSPLLKFVDSAA